MRTGHLHTLEEATSIAQRWRDDGWEDVIVERAVLFAWKVIDERQPDPPARQARPDRGEQYVCRRRIDRAGELRESGFPYRNVFA